MFSPSSNSRSKTGRYSESKSFSKPIASPLPKPLPSQILIESIHQASAYIGDACEIKNAEYVASFNWTEGKDTTILVPGKPPRWSPPKATSRLHEDADLYYRDPNSAKFPSHPTEPAVRAIMETCPRFSVDEIDLFGCGNTVGSLLSFVRGEDRTFRFGVDRIGSSVFLVRRTNEPGELIDNVHGYGHTFPEAYTQWDKSVKGSMSHQRIIKYDFAGLKCFIRSECDGFLPAELNGKTNTLDTSDDNGSSAVEDQARLLALDFKMRDDQPTSANIIIRLAGGIVPQDALFDLKTRTLRNKTGGVSVAEFLQRLWENQTPNMIMAYHTRGRFDPDHIHIIDARVQVQEWAKQQSGALSRLGGILHKLIEVAQGDRSRCFEVRRTGSGPLELWSERPTWSALPRELQRTLGVDMTSRNGASTRSSLPQKDDPVDGDKD